MEDQGNALVAKEESAIELPANQKLLIENSDKTSVLTLIDSEGKASLSVTVTDQGPVLHLSGASLILQTEGNLAIDAKNVAIHGRESVAFSTDGNMNLQAKGELATKANAQSITADLGNVDIEANDDVAMKGLRIKMNC